MNTEQDQSQSAFNAIIEVSENLLLSTDEQNIKGGLRLIISIARHKTDNRSAEELEKYKFIE